MSFSYFIYLSAHFSLGEKKVVWQSHDDLCQIIKWVNGAWSRLYGTKKAVVNKNCFLIIINEMIYSILSQPFFIVFHNIFIELCGVVALLLLANQAPQPIHSGATGEKLIFFVEKETLKL